jgi:hypothetical protein
MAENFPIGAGAINPADQLFQGVNSAKILSEKANQFGPSVKRLGPGSLVQFTYIFAEPGHDKNPLVLITRLMNNYIKGINLHYLSFPVIKNILQPSGMNACNNPNFSYNMIKTNRAIPDAFKLRQYKKIGISRLKIMDCNFILNVMGTVRAIDPQEVEAIRNTIRDQLSRTINQNVPGTVG